MPGNSVRAPKCREDAAEWDWLPVLGIAWAGTREGQRGSPM